MKVHLRHRFTSYCILALLLCFSCKLTYAQQFFEIDGNHKRATIPFKLIRDMVIVKLNINGKGPYNFILDSGVGVMIVTEPKLIDSLNLTSKRLLKITGLGNNESYDAYVTSSLKVTMPGVSSNSVSAAIFAEDHFGLSNYAGMPIHGLLGYEFFNSFAVKVNFDDSTLTVGQSENIRAFRRGSKLTLSIEDRKPYIKTNILINHEKLTDAKLIVDLGAGHSLSLENLIERNSGLPDKFISANLGVGITGPIKGFMSRIEELNIGKYKLKDVIVSFPEIDSTKKQELSVKRDGSLGIEVLKKFNLVIDYPREALYLKPNEHFKEPFEHDMSGLEYYTTGTNYKHVIISRVERGSAADEVGLIKGDEILAINFRSVQDMSIEDIDNIFRSRNDRSVLLDIFHDNVYDKVILRLKRRI